MVKKYHVDAVPKKEKKDRLNPQILRILFGYLVQVRFGGTLATAYNSLKTSRPRYKQSSPKPIKPFTKNSLTGVLNDKQAISYIMLEAFADEAGIPTWVLLLFSRALSDDTDHHQSTDAEFETIELNIRRTIAFLEFVQRKLNDRYGLPKADRIPMEIDEINEWIEEYHRITSEQRELL